MLRYLMENYVREAQTRYGYQHVWTGHLVKEDLYQRSGHYDNYKDVMFPPMVDENITFRLKPMNCPSHMTLYKEMGLHSYRELPLRFAEFATLYRYEKTRRAERPDARARPDAGRLPHLLHGRADRAGILAGAAPDPGSAGALPLHGLPGPPLAARRRAASTCRTMRSGTRPRPRLRAALDANGVDYFEADRRSRVLRPEGRFPGPDVLGREWQLSTIQVDFIQPARLGLTYIGEDGQEHTPVVLHRAVTGSTERFLGVVIEHFAGAFPVWLAPVQAVLIPIADRHLRVRPARWPAKLKAAGLRVEVDERSERMNAKIRDAQKQKIPYMLVVGEKKWSRSRWRCACARVKTRDRCRWRTFLSACPAGHRDGRLTRRR